MAYHCEDSFEISALKDHLSAAKGTIKRLESELAESKRKHNECFTDMTSHLEAERAKVMELEDELAAVKGERDKAREFLSTKMENLNSKGKTIFDFQAVWISQERNINRKLRARCERMESLIKMFMVQFKNVNIYEYISNHFKEIEQALEVPK